MRFSHAATLSSGKHKRQLAVEGLEFRHLDIYVRLSPPRRHHLFERDSVPLKVRQALTHGCRDDMLLLLLSGRRSRISLYA